MRCPSYSKHACLLPLFMNISIYLNGEKQIYDVLIVLEKKNSLIQKQARLVCQSILYPLVVVQKLLQDATIRPIH